MTIINCTDCGQPHEQELLDEICFECWKTNLDAELGGKE